MCVGMWGRGGDGWVWVGREVEVSEHVREVAGGSRHRWKGGSLSTPSSGLDWVRECCLGWSGKLYE